MLIKASIERFSWFNLAQVAVMIKNAPMSRKKGLLVVFRFYREELWQGETSLAIRKQKSGILNRFWSLANNGGTETDPLKTDTETG